MTTRLRAGFSAVCLTTAGVLLQPSLGDFEQFAAAGTRPLMLPFAWRSLEESNRVGDSGEAFARAQRILDLLPTWADGHAAFAYRFVLATGDSPKDPQERGRSTWLRLQLALAFLEDARPRAGRHEPGLLQMLAFLPEVAQANEPALAPLLAPLGGPAAFADRYLAEAERKFPRPAIREQRTFFAPRIAAGLLAAGDRSGAHAVLVTAIQRSHDVRDQELATEWRQRLDEVVRWLDGDRSVDLTAVRADLRMEVLLPHLR